MAERNRWFLALVMLCACMHARAADDLLAIYRDAMLNNADYQAARLGVEADRQDVDIAKAQLLPALALSGNSNQSKTDRTAPNVLGTPKSDSFTYNNYSYSLNLRQPLYRPALSARLRQSHAVLLSSEANLDKTAQDLAVKVVAAYCDALFAIDQHRLVLAQREALTAQLNAAQRSFQVGSGTLTDIDEAQSKLDIVNVQEIEAANRIEDTKRSIGALIGRDVTMLLPLNPAKIEQGMLELHSLNDWIADVEKHNPELESLRNQVAASEEEVSKTREGHFPTLDFVASRTDSANDSTTTLSKSGDTKYQTTSIGVQLNLPLFNGGAVNASVRQARAKLEQARYKYEEVRRNLGVEVRKQYNATMQGLARSRALQQAQESSIRLVYSEGKGIQAGTRTSIDLLLAEQQLNAARKDLAESRYSYLVSRIRLMSLAGAISEQEIVRMNSWFGNPASHVDETAVTGDKPANVE